MYMYKLMHACVKIRTQVFVLNIKKKKMFLNDIYMVVLLLIYVDVGLIVIVIVSYCYCNYNYSLLLLFFIVIFLHVKNTSQNKRKLLQNNIKINYKMYILFCCL